jgi:DNA-binding NtrC family response regulator
MEKLHSRQPNLPVVLMSGTFDAGKTPLPAQAAAFLAKPFRFEQLLAVVAGVLRANRPANKHTPSETGLKVSLPS